MDCYNVRTCYSSTHEWNMIEFNGKWYEFDCTFDDGKAIVSWNWFNKSRETIGLDDDHILENESFKLQLGGQLYINRLLRIYDQIKRSKKKTMPNKQKIEKPFHAKTR